VTDNEITVDNWGLPPFNRWSFQHVQSLFPTTRICRGDGPVTHFEKAHKELSAISYTGLNGKAAGIIAD
jgi:hypothetical protein